MTISHEVEILQAALQYVTSKAAIFQDFTQGKFSIMQDTTNRAETETKVSRYIYANCNNHFIKKQIHSFQSCGYFYNCNKLYCNHCQQIKSNRFFHKYKKILETRQSLGNCYYLLTIAPKRVKGDELRQALANIKSSYKKSSYYIKSNFKGGITRLELTFEPYDNTYKPHYHSIIESDHRKTEKELKAFLAKIARKFTESDFAIIATRNDWNSIRVVLCNEQITFDLEEIIADTETRALRYIFKPADFTGLFNNSDYAIQLIVSIPSNSRFFMGFGTLKGAPINKQQKIKNTIRSNETEKATETFAKETDKAMTEKDLIRQIERIRLKPR